MRPLAIAALASLSLSSCGLIDDLSSPTGYCIAQIKQFCRAQFQCCTATERQQIFGAFIIFAGDPYDTEGECVEEYTEICEAYGQGNDEAVEEGRMEYDQAKAQKCVDEMKKDVDECNAEGLLTRDDDCDEALQGNVKEGDKCFSDAECKEDGSVCERDTSDGDDIVVTLEGECKALGEEGDPCTDDSECKSDFCVEQEEETCSNTGDVCFGDDSDCYEDFCSDGLNCDESGDPCDFDEDCNPDAFCEFNDGGGECSGEGEEPDPDDGPDVKYEVCDGLE